MPKKEKKEKKISAKNIAAENNNKKDDEALKCAIQNETKHLCVLDAYVNPNNPKQVLIECDDGNTYTHHEIK